jgi:hypothetical protein
MHNRQTCIISGLDLIFALAVLLDVHVIQVMGEVIGHSCVHVPRILIVIGGYGVAQALIITMEHLVELVVVREGVGIAPLDFANMATRRKRLLRPLPFPPLPLPFPPPPLQLPRFP